MTRIKNELPPFFTSWIHLLAHITKHMPSALEGERIQTEDDRRRRASDAPTIYVIDIDFMKQRAGEEAAQIAIMHAQSFEKIYSMERHLMQGLYDRSCGSAASEVYERDYAPILNSIKTFALAGK